MPVQIILSEGLISKEVAQTMHHEVSNALLEVHELSNNPFMTPNVIGEVVFVDKDLTFSGGEVCPLAIVELRVPSFTFGTQSQKDQFVRKATDIVFNACEGKLPRNSIWVNAVYAVDGLWGIGGKAYTNEALAEAITRSAGEVVT